jgi:replicative DNA helicase
MSPPEDAERLPPQNLEAEQTVLSALLVDREIFPAVMEHVEPASFYRRAHGLIYAAMVSLYEAGEPVDFLTVRNALLGRDQLEEVGGFGYLQQLAASIPTTAHAESYARIVAEKAGLRSLIHAGSNVVSMAFSGESLEVVADAAEREILGAVRRRAVKGVSTIATGLQAAYDEMVRRSEHPGELLGVSSGFYDLDRKLLGFQPSDLLILAARPAMGKTSLALNFCRSVAVESRKPVLFYSLEMSEGQLLKRLVSLETGVDLQAIQTGYMSQAQWRKVTDAIGTLSEAPIVVRDVPDITVQQMRADARRVQAEMPDLGLVMVDYLQLMASGSSSKGENRTVEMGAISRGLKKLARELRVPVIALSQLSRAVESRTDKRPMLSDLRESGAIEQDADIVMFIYRDEYYNPESDKKALAEVIIAKHRNGPVGSVDLHFEKQTTKFSSVAS